jgi:thiol-disulfide isomerase/thioredoxin
VSSGKQWLVIGVIVAALGTALLVASRTIGAELFPLKIGSRAPDFSAVELATADAAPASTAPRGIDDYRGQVVLLNIWATWCAPCRVEMPSMQRLEEQLGPKGLRIVAVSIDDPGMEQRLLYDSAGEIQQQYQTTGVPETFIIGRDGRIRRRIIGADDWSSESNIAFLERLLDEPAS